MNPIRCRPYLRPLVWGGRRLGDVLGKVLPTPEAYGESWEISDHVTHRIEIVDGPSAGRTLRDLMETERSALLGPAAHRFTTFPWLIKHLDANDWLSVQVHPDDKTARRLWPGEGGKTEAWFILDAGPDACVYAGLKPGIDAPRLRQALANRTVVDCLHAFRPRPGDCLFLPAGTVHAVGVGVLMAEIQQTSDATFRLYDWDRVDAQGQPRQLHIEQALECIDWSRGPVDPVRARGYPQPGEKNTSRNVRQTLVRCAFFDLEYIRVGEPMPLGRLGQLQVIIVLHGRGRLGDLSLTPAVTVLLPASMTEMSCVPDGPLGLLRATLPNA